MGKETGFIEFERVQVTNYVFTPKKDNQKKGAETKV